MKILLVDKLRYPFGGTQRYVFSLANLLKKNGHQVWLYDGFNLISTKEKNNKNIATSKPKSLFFFIQSIYSPAALVRSIIRILQIKPDVIHLNNISYQITPAIIHAAKICSVPIVMTLHDYKIVCARYRLLDNQLNPCDDCKNNNLLSIFKHKCTLNGSKSLIQTLFLFLESYIHTKLLNIYRHVNMFIAPSDYLAKKYKYMGFKYPIQVIHNFTDYQKNKNIYKINEKKKIIYFGRLEKEKGILLLCEAMKNLPISLTIVGDGTLLPEIKQFSKKYKNIKILKFIKNKNQLFDIVKKHDFSIVPSIWPENCSMSILESFSCGVPVLASNLGGNKELLINNFNGLLFNPHNGRHIKAMLVKIHQMKPKELKLLTINSKKTFLDNYTEKNYYSKLFSLYNSINDTNK